MRDNIKVFQMDDYDYVAAINKDEAIEFYIAEVGISKEEIEEIKICSLRLQGIYTPVSTNEALGMLSRLAIGEKVNGRWNLKFAAGDGELGVWKSFEEILAESDKKTPYIIASTGY
jgi:hypothetical protein